MTAEPQLTHKGRLIPRSAACLLAAAYARIDNHRELDPQLARQLAKHGVEFSHG